MKKFIRISILLLLVFVIQVKAQPVGPITTPITAYLPSELTEIGNYVFIDTTDPVEPDFPLDTFTKGNCAHIDLGGGCYLEYTYYYRLAGNIYHDIYVSSYSIKGDSCLMAGPPYTADQIKFFITTIMQQIMANCNPWGNSIPPCEENTTYPIWRLGHPSCVTEPHWVYDPVNQWFFKSVTSCQLNSQTPICWNIVSYCWKYVNGLMVLQENTISTGVSSSTCPPFLEGCLNVPCIPICDVGGSGGE
ncbi:MAG: hypothetical protein IJK61_05705 [Bacteroidetes bacterium]|nr:hypothetical protein [Bacteroidota bacterium]